MKDKGTFRCTLCNKVLGHKAMENGKIACKKCKPAVDNVVHNDEKHLVTRVRFIASTLAVIEKAAA